MRSRGHGYRKSLLRMDPDCAICRAPADVNCGCESKGLETALKQAEQRIMQSMYLEIRTWVRQHAQDYVLAFFGQLSEQRKAAHAAQLQSLKHNAYYFYNGAQPHPSDIERANIELKEGLDADWQRSVQRYPEVLEYFFSLVEVTLPLESDPYVKDLSMETLPVSRKVSRRGRSQAPPATTVASGSVHNGGSREGHGHVAPLIRRGRTPPAIMEQRRTPGPPAPELQRYQPPPAPRSAYNGGGHYPPGY